MKKTKPINKLLELIFGRHYLNNFKVVRSISDIPKKMVSFIWGRDAERYFNLYMDAGRFIWIKKDDNQYLVHVGNNGTTQIVDEKDRVIEPSVFENILGLPYVGLSAENFFKFLLKRDDDTKVVKLTESDLMKLVERVLVEQKNVKVVLCKDIGINDGHKYCNGITKTKIIQIECGNLGITDPNTRGKFVGQKVIQGMCNGKDGTPIKK